MNCSIRFRRYVHPPEGGLKIVEFVHYGQMPQPFPGLTVWLRNGERYLVKNVEFDSMSGYFTVYDSEPDQALQGQVKDLFRSGHWKEVVDE